MAREYKGVSLFSGAGGMDVGFEMAGVDVVWANECDKDACDTYEANHPGVIRRGYIEEYMGELEGLKGIDIVFGGPPCQGFSFAGLRRKNDPRNLLFRHYIKTVELVKPKFLLLENVGGSTTARSKGGSRRAARCRRKAAASSRTNWCDGPSSPFRRRFLCAHCR